MGNREIKLTDRPRRRKFWQSTFMVLGASLVALQVTQVPTLFGWESRAELVEKHAERKDQKQLLAVTVTLTSGTSWSVPANCNLLSSVECYGGGGGGAAGASNTGYAGGGGGAYSAITNLAVTPGGSVSYAIGAGGAGWGRNPLVTGTAGGDTWFGSSGTVLAKGGSDPGAASSPGGAGGLAASGVGTTKFSGGTGGTSSSATNSGGGGGCAGPSGNGTSVTPNNNVNGGAGGGGQAGSGGTSQSTVNTNQALTSGDNYGGGGAGGRGNPSLNTKAGNGAPGIIVLTYTPVAPPAASSFGYIF